jgi:hypothetical protein
MQPKKIFRHIEFFLDTKKKHTIIIFAINQNIDAEILNNFQNYKVEIKYRGIRATSIPDENIITQPFQSEGPLVWIQVSLDKKMESFSTCECFLYKNNQIIGQKNIALGYKIRDRFNHVKKIWINTIFVKLLFLLNIKNKPIISLHLWHLDVAIEILQVFQETSRFYDLRISVPDNLDKQISTQLQLHIKKYYKFNSICTLAVPAYGRDIGGFITSLIHSIKNSEYKNRPHLFLHTKNTSELHSLMVRRWRDSLVYDIAFNANFSFSLFLFKNLQASIVYSRSNDRIENGNDDIEARKASYDLAKLVQYELFNKSNNQIRFCAGTMMWVLPSRVEKVWSIEKLQSVLSKLEPSQTMQEPSHAHAFERLFPHIVQSSGLKVFTI